VRVGRTCDGGYVVNGRAIRSATHLLSAGIGDDWSFEADFLRRKADLEVLCFDFSVSEKIFWHAALNQVNELLSPKSVFLSLTLNFGKLQAKFSNLKRTLKIHREFSSFVSHENIHFFPLAVSEEAGEGCITPEQLFQKLPRNERGNSVFLKIDIEGSEFRVLPQFLDFHDQICGMVIEFHELDLLWNNFAVLMSQVKAHFDITHIHGNNGGGLIKGTQTPRILEITFLNKRLMPQEVRGRDDVTYPIAGLDWPNDRFAPDLALLFGEQEAVSPKQGHVQSHRPPSSF
jgi:hypothetical protein